MYLDRIIKKTRKGRTTQGKSQQQTKKAECRDP